ncbi:MAG: DNA gyrase/topoisomerase IV subunit A [Bacteroidales bacterium]|nr:DNA gyrase/topoisomerase IV subunit A [Bacteroidales bacterium]
MTDDPKNLDDEIVDENVGENVVQEDDSEPSDLHKVIFVQSMYREWFLDYASYVILDRAFPDVYDGLKPVQRRILHSMDELEDGHFNKVANIVGNTMKYHPHGDQSIYSALVAMGQKNYVIDTQGNWGNILTGDPAAAPRYIEARLSKFAQEVVFNHKTTDWQVSYDGRNKEPIALPIKFPLLLAQGVDGVGVGMSTKILPHNFNELIDASIHILKGEDFEIFPDFPTGGAVDVSKYLDGAQGGKVRNRAKISIVDNKTLVITEIPYGTTTGKLITESKNSITAAVDADKLKIKKIDDNTAEHVEIYLHLAPGVSPDQTIDALYAFTDCEITYSTNACVIWNGHPVFSNVKDILRINTENTLNLLRRELEIELDELDAKWHKISLEKIFFEKRIYKELEKDVESWESQVDNIERAFDPYRNLFRREITREDVLALCEKPVRKISKFDIKKAEEDIADIEANIDEVQNHLNHIVDYTINYFRQLKKKYGAAYPRLTEIKNFDTIVASTVAVANQKLYVDKAEGFIGTSLKKDEGVEYACDCSDLDEVIVFHEDGKFIITKVADKKFVGKNILHVEVFKRGDDRHIFNLAYVNGTGGATMVKRFAIGGVSRDKEYDVTKGKSGSKILYFTSNPNGEAEVIRVKLKPKAKLKKKEFDYDFSKLAVKARASLGNLLTHYPVSSITMSQKGVSTLSAINIYFEESVMRLNTEERGVLLGAFKEDDKILTVYKSGNYRITGFELTTHFEDDLGVIKKWNKKQIITTVYYQKKEDKYYMKRFLPDTLNKKIDFVPDDGASTIIGISVDYLPQIKVVYREKKAEKDSEIIISCAEFVELMSFRARGKRVNFPDIKKVTFVEPLPYDEPEEEPEEELPEVNEEELESVDDAVAKDIFKDIKVEKSDPSEGGDDDGDQLSLF